MRRSKSYTDELEKINRDDSGIALTIKLKKATAKKLRFRITGFAQAEYWYVLSNKGYMKADSFLKKQIKINTLFITKS